MDGIDPEKNPLLVTGADNPSYDEDGEQIQMQDINKEASTSRCDSFDYTHKEETSFGGEPSYNTTLNSLSKNMGEAWGKIQVIFPECNPAKSPFIARLDEFDQVIGTFKRKGGKPFIIIGIDGEINYKNIPQTALKFLGRAAEEIYEHNKEKIAKNKEIIYKLEDQLATTSDADQQENIRQSIAENQDENSQLERVNEEIEQRMTLRDRVKVIFKKYGFTVLSVASAVGVVIGVIVANLKNGLTSLGKGVGNGLKTIGKKLGEILPGLVGAIASFVFRTAGEVVGFLAKNAWLLIVGVVIHLVEQFKNKK